MPLHAATWDERGKQVCLIDRSSVRFAPSASILAGCLAHVANRDGEIKPLALGNPTSNHPLPAAEVEAAQMVELLGGGQLALGAEATSDVLRRADADTTHLHLATHAGGSLVDLAESGIILSDGWLRGPDVGAALSFEPRLAVISACQSAMISMAGAFEESLSIASVFLAAGSACVIATLWPVNDLTTALLMTRLYEELLLQDPPVDPPTALTRAQLWLRDLTTNELAEFLDRYPALEKELNRRGEGDNHGLRMPHGGSAVPEFGPQHWAGFVAFGA